MPDKFFFNRLFPLLLLATILQSQTFILCEVVRTFSYNYESIREYGYDTKLDVRDYVESDAALDYDTLSVECPDHVNVTDSVVGSSLSEGSISDEWLFVIHSSNKYLIAADEKMSVYDLSDPENPEIVNSFNLNDLHSTIFIDENDFVFLASDYGTTFAVYDMSDPLNEVLISDVYNLGSYTIGGLVVKDNKMYVSANDYDYQCDEYEFMIFSVNTKAPESEVFELLGKYEWNEEYGNEGEEPNQIVIKGDIAYISCKTGGVKAFDVSDPTDIKLIGSYVDDTLEPEYLKISDDGTKIFASEYLLNGILVMDITSSSGIPEKIIRYTEISASHGGIALEGNYIIAGHEDIYVIDVSDILEPVVVSYLPNDAWYDFRYPFVSPDKKHFYYSLKYFTGYGYTYSIQSFDFLIPIKIVQGLSLLAGEQTVSIAVCDVEETCYDLDFVFDVSCPEGFSGKRCEIENTVVASQVGTAVTLIVVFGLLFCCCFVVIVVVVIVVVVVVVVVLKKKQMMGKETDVVVDIEEKESERKEQEMEEPELKQDSAVETERT